jgi:hypothetical protein
VAARHKGSVFVAQTKPQALLCTAKQLPRFQVHIKSTALWVKFWSNRQPQAPKAAVWGLKTVSCCHRLLLLLLLLCEGATYC